MYLVMHACICTTLYALYVHHCLCVGSSVHFYKQKHISMSKSIVNGQFIVPYAVPLPLAGTLYSTQAQSLSTLLIQNFTPLAPILRNYLLAHHPSTQCYEYVRPDFDRTGEGTCLVPDSRQLFRALAPQSNHKSNMRRRRKSLRAWRLQSRARRGRFADRPLRPLNPYTLFTQMESKHVKDEYPGLSSSYIMQICARRYKQLSEDQRKPFIEKYEAERRDYMLRREEFFKNNPTADYRTMK